MERREEEITRVRIPREGQMLGMVEEMLGGGRFRVNCTDKNTRICRVSGKFKRSQWIRPGDIVLVEPWEIESNEKGNVVWKYRKAQVEWLEKRGFLKDF
ncbi:MAG: translation initiation factor eIF-1A [Candidatus Aenigmarchaeota archaeon]|nr:translation initiation factor eIF-1A [Candidatus Aenigmarchaeota archaeon]